MSKDWKIIHFEDPYEAAPDTLASDTGLLHEERSVGVTNFSGDHPRILAVSSDPFIWTSVDLRGVLEWAARMRPDLIAEALAGYRPD